MAKQKRKSTKSKSTNLAGALPPHVMKKSVATAKRPVPPPLKSNKGVPNTPKAKSGMPQSSPTY